MPPKKKLKAAARAPADKPPQQQSTRPHRTLQTPFQHTDDTLYTVEKITVFRWSGGARNPRPLCTERDKVSKRKNKSLVCFTVSVLGEACA